MGSITDLTALSDLQGAVSLLVVLLARIGPIVWLAPFLGGPLVPSTVKPAVALMFAALVFPHVVEVATSLGEAAPAMVIAVLVKEALIGFSLGFFVSLIFHTVQSAGWLVDSARGANLAESLVPQTRRRSSPLGSLSFQLTLVTFLALGGHRLLIAALLGSYEALPLTEWVAVEGARGLAALAIRLTADLVLLALALTAPVVAALVLSDMVLGVINRFVPQVNVFFLAMPLKALLGIAVFALSVSLLLGALPPLVEHAASQVGRAVRLLSP